MPRQTSIQLTPAQEAQIETLRGAGFGNTTDVIRIAVDRMFQKEIATIKNRNLTDDAWVRRVDELRQYVSDQYDPTLGTPDEFVELAAKSGEYDDDDLAVIRREAVRVRQANDAVDPSQSE